MLIYSLLFSIVFTLSLFGTPNIAQIKAAVEANPALLDTNCDGWGSIKDGN